MINASSSSIYPIADNDGLIKFIGTQGSRALSPVVLGKDYELEEVKAYIEKMQAYVNPIVRKKLGDDTQLVVSIETDNNGHFPLGKRQSLKIKMSNKGPFTTERITIKIHSLPDGFKLKLSDSSNESEQLIPHEFELGNEFNLGKGQYKLPPGSNEEQIYYLEAPNFFQVGDIEVEVSAQFENNIYRTVKESIHIYSNDRKGSLQVSPSEELYAKIRLGDSYVENKQMLNLTNAGEKDIVFFLPIRHDSWLSSAPVDLPYDWLKSVPAYLPYDKYALLSTDTQKGKIAFWPHESAYQLKPGKYETPIILEGMSELYRSKFILEVEAPSFLSVKGQEEIEIAGKKGGSFYPNRLTYTLENTGSEVLHWKTTLNDSDYEDSWFEVSPAEGHLEPNSATVVEFKLNNSFVKKLEAGVEITYLKFENVDFPNNSHLVLIKRTVVEDLTKVITVSVVNPNSAVFRPSSSTLLSWFTNKSSPNDKMSLLMKRDKIGDKLDESEEGKSWHIFAFESPNDGSEQVQIPETVEKADDWRFHVIYLFGDFDSNRGFSKKFSIASEVTTVVVDNSELSHAYQPGNSLLLSWNSLYTLPNDKMVLSMKRDSAHSLSEPDNIDWYRFTLDTKNDGSEWVKIPKTISKADDWHFYVSHVDSGVFGSSHQFSIDDSAIAVSINDSALANAYQPGNSVLLSWEISNTPSSNKEVVVSMKRDAAAVLAEPDNINWYRFSLDTLDDGSEQLEIPVTVAEGSDWRFYVKHVDSGAYSASHKVIVANSAIAVMVDSSKLSDAYRPGSSVSLSWFTSNNALPDDDMVLSMKRDSAASLSEPDGKNWYRFVLDTPNDGSELVQIPETVTEADDWRFYVKHVNSGVYNASQRFSISIDAADAATIHSTAQGGYWGSQSTWLEGRVPTENDIVEIRGTVDIDYRYRGTMVAGLIVNANGRLNGGEGLNFSLKVNGNVLNYGSITNGNMNDGNRRAKLVLYISGDIVNNGVWNVLTILTGTMSRTIKGASNTNLVFADNFEIKNDASFGSVQFGNDVTLTVDKPNTLTFGSYISSDYRHKSTIKGTGTLIFHKSRLTDSFSINVGEVKFLNGGHLNMRGEITAEKLTFAGEGEVDISRSLIFNGPVVIEKGITIKEKDIYNWNPILNINGDITNYGSIMGGLKISVWGNISNEGTWQDAPTKVFWENVPNFAYYELNITEPLGKWSKHIIRSNSYDYNSYDVTNLLDTTHYWTVRANINGEFTPWSEIKNINGTLDYTLSLFSINDFVWHDENGNGIQDTSESGIADVEVELFTSDGLSQGTVTTDNNGAYAFSDIFAGDYYLQFILPSGYIFTQQDQGNDDDIDSDVKPTDGTTAVFTLMDGVNNFSTHAGIRQLPVAECGFSDGFETGALSDYWSTYITKNGRVQVNSKYPKTNRYSVLLDDNSRSSSNYSHAAIILTANLAEQSNVFLSFWWREFGDENQQDDGIFISDDNGTHWSRVFSFNNGPEIFRNDVVDIVAQAADKGLTLNERFQIKFQFYDNYSIPGDGYAIDDIQLSCEMPTASIGNLVWHDANGNGIQGANEPGIANASVELFTSEGVSQGTTKTDSKGAYAFTDISAGDYYLQFSLPTGYNFTSQDKGSDEGLDSDVNPENATTAIFTVESGVDNFSLDAGVQQNGTLQFGVSSYTVAENGGLVTIEVTRSNGSANAVSINYASSDSTAIAASDYTSTSGTLSWAKGDTAPKHFTVKILDDKLYENDETFTIALSNPTGGANLGTQSSATVTIVMDAKDSPILTLSTSPTGFAENAGANASIGTVTRNSLQGALTVNLSSSDTTEVRVPNSVTIPDGKTSATFAITAIDDMTADGLQTVILTAGATDYASATTLVNVTDNLLTDKIDSSGTCLTGLDCDRLLSQHLIIKQTDVLNMTTHIVV
ncbi:MAG: SdrD B-like domain-containing protein, partial [Candidatus Parabeggiatoa sp.]|nr:SdrD B-like domain-containing protein [Candidatus Parabeggiatoa sp.]